MSTPTLFSIPPPDAHDVAARLQDELRRRQEATPEAVFGDRTPEQSYNWLCELEHRKMTPRQVDGFRATIHHADYRRHEALHLKDALFHAMWQRLCDQHAADGLQVLRHISAARDHQIYEQLRSQATDTQVMSSSPESQRAQPSRAPKRALRRQPRSMAEPRRSKRLRDSASKCKSLTLADVSCVPPNKRLNDGKSTSPRHPSPPPHGKASFDTANPRSDLLWHRTTSSQWLIMEWMPLDLRSVSLNVDDIPIILQQVGSGLAFMHANSFTHRDMKPENILVYQHVGGFSAKIADVGLSKYNVRGKMLGYAGSIVYMAPEFWESERGYTSAVDMWSFGIIALELLTAWESMLEGTNATMQPSKSWNQDWIRISVMPRVGLAPAACKPLLRNLLCEAPEERWTAPMCDNWLQKHALDVNNSQVDDYGYREQSDSVGVDDSDNALIRRLLLLFFLQF
ncbi:kinase [Hirsutella rhossiliensis]|uniref:non-specific serine/threonine protein kinase n=1 Tax=Hirsutella rhossiliensis TaxID=111463 RepID=A0A9P8SFZ8_9HYPO|nr:kinase [Hirsutella rhossiliensis]KAH0959526.1 kinase [Hirsutella rhossiliensis]